MKKIDPIIWKETRYVTAWVLILSALMEAVFLVIGQWDYTVLLGNLLGGAVAVLNFLFMGMTVQVALHKEEKEAKQTVRLSMVARTFGLFVCVALGVLLPVFSTWTVIIPLFFTRLAIAFRPRFDKRTGEGTVSEEQEEANEK